MSILDTQNELKKAISSKDLEIIEDLANSPAMIVRRCVAKNIFTPEKIINKLAFDPSTNVSYLALSHPNCTVTRNNLRDNHPCIRCMIDEIEMDCENCSILFEYQNSSKE